MVDQHKVLLPLLWNMSMAAGGVPHGTLRSDLTSQRVAWTYVSLE